MFRTQNFHVFELKTTPYPWFCCPFSPLQNYYGGPAFSLAD